VAKNVHVSLIAHRAYDSGGPVIIACEFVNRGNHPLWLLKWFTPFEPLSSACFRVEIAGAEVDYDGPLARRAAPAVGDYVILPPHTVVTASVNLRAAYDLSSGGEYYVRFKSHVIVIEDEPDDARPDFQRDGLSLESAPVVFAVAPGGGVHTIGAAARAATHLLAMEKAAVAAGAPVPPKFNGGNDAQAAAARAAHQNGFDLCGNALARLADDPHFEEFFGAFDAGRFAKARAVFSKIDARMRTTQFTYDLTGHGCDPSWMAFTTKGADTITICPMFWNASPSGIASQAGTVVHEHSHCDAGTDDIPPSGIAGARFLAATDPDSAAKNADNFESYAET
jgi:peptidyl-Lys metalloendopeptidase